MLDLVFKKSVILYWLTICLSIGTILSIYFSSLLVILKIILIITCMGSIILGYKRNNLISRIILSEEKIVCTYQHHDLEVKIVPEKTILSVYLVILALQSVDNRKTVFLPIFADMLNQNDFRQLRKLLVIANPKLLYRSDQKPWFQNLWQNRQF